MKGQANIIIFCLLTKKRKSAYSQSTYSRDVKARIYREPWSFYIIIETDNFHNQRMDLMDLLERVQYKAALIVSGCWQGTGKIV